MKGRNTWVRDPNAPQGGPTTDSKIAKGEGPGPIKVGRFKLVRSPSLLSARQHHQQQQRTLPARAPKPDIDKSKFKYERPKQDVGQEVPVLGTTLPSKVQQQAVATGGGASKPQNTKVQKPQAAVPPKKRKGNFTWINPSIDETKLNVPTEAKPSKPEQASPAPRARVQPMRSGKAKWNSYVRPGASIEPLKSTKSSMESGKPIARTPKASGGVPGTVAIPKRASARLKSAEKRRLPVQAQRATKLLRLGGRLYSAGSRGKGRSLTLQAASTQNGAPAAAPTEQQRQPLAVSRRKSGPLTKRTVPSPYKKVPVIKKTLKKSASLKPSERLKGGPRVKYCPVYCHTGKCPRRGRGCSLRHDPTKRAVCTQWLLGRCGLGKACLLQHQRKPELMPACVHYLQGCCTNSACPWLHVNVRQDAGYCSAFLRGYCAAGTSCALKHYTLRQVKEERRLVAGGSSRKTTSKKTEAATDAPRPRKRRERYFDFEESDVEESDVEENPEQQAALSSESNASSDADADEENSDEGSSEALDGSKVVNEEEEEAKSLDSRSTEGRRLTRRSSSLLNLDFIQL